MGFQDIQVYKKPYNAGNILRTYTTTESLQLEGTHEPRHVISNYVAFLTRVDSNEPVQPPF